jgi:glyoxylase-like metal-dependent hydrolase (beta-lactamase superfamily II)
MRALTVEMMPSPPLETNAYLVGDAAAARAIVIDPSFLGDVLLGRCAERNWTLEAIVLTHAHVDHTHDVPDMVRRLRQAARCEAGGREKGGHEAGRRERGGHERGGHEAGGREARGREAPGDAETPVLAHPKTAEMLRDADLCGASWLGFDFEPVAVTRYLNDGDRVSVGGCELEVIHTPGHSPGSICLLGPEECFTGDLLFRDAVGRWDLPGGDLVQLRASLLRLAERCDDALTLYPGHGERTTMGRERRENPYLLEWLRGDLRGEL